MIDRRIEVSSVSLAAALAIGLSSCGPSDVAPREEARPVRVVTVEQGRVTIDLQLAGEIQAQTSVTLAFRVAGRVVERAVNIGDTVSAGQVVARLDPTTERNAVTSATAALASARGALATARSAFERQDRLMAQGFTTRPRFDEALRVQEAAEAQLEAAEAELQLALDRLGFTELRADAAGIVTTQAIEAGEVVQAGQTVLELARDDGRDAVFNVPARLMETRPAGDTVHVSLVGEPNVTAVGRVREVSPQADPVLRTFRVRVGLHEPPQAMRLGATVKGAVELRSATSVSIPASALTQLGTSPAVWIVDPTTSTVLLRAVDLLRFEPEQVIISSGLQPGDTVVTAGVQALHPGQRVKPLRPTATSAPRTTAATTDVEPISLMARLPPNPKPTTGGVSP